MNKFLNFFETNGLLKILASIVLLALITILFNNTEWEVLRYVIWIPASYLITAFILFFGAAIINTFKDFKNKWYHWFSWWLPASLMLAWMLCSFILAHRYLKILTRIILILGTAVLINGRMVFFLTVKNFLVPAHSLCFLQIFGIYLNSWCCLV